MRPPALFRTLTTAILIALAIPSWGLGQRRSSSSIATERIFDALQVREGTTVCEIGAGSGELSIAAARITGPDGRVFTSELGDERVGALRRSVADSELAHITVVEGDPVKSNFPDAACDALFMRNVYHHFAEPSAMNTSLWAAVAPGGRVAIVDFTPPGGEAEAPADRCKDGQHGVSAESVGAELKAAGFEIVDTERGADRWFMVVASKPR